MQVCWGWRGELRREGDNKLNFSTLINGFHRCPVAHRDRKWLGLEFCVEKYDIVGELKMFCDSPARYGADTLHYPKGSGIKFSDSQLPDKDITSNFQQGGGNFTACGTTPFGTQGIGLHGHGTTCG